MNDYADVEEYLTIRKDLLLSAADAGIASIMEQVEYLVRSGDKIVEQKYGVKLVETDGGMTYIDEGDKH
jgi:hypothetical protein